MIKRLFLLLLVLTATPLLCSALIISWYIVRSDKVQNYADALGPSFVGAFAPDDLPLGEDLLVVSYNIRYAKEIEQAIEELKTSAELANADVVLLQEMDESATAEIADALDTNFVYFPAAIHANNGKNFGTAILSRWPLSDPEKIILPHASLGEEMIRTTTKATAEIHGQPVDLFSTHIETIVAPPWHRMNQVQTLADVSAETLPCAIVGGDFNTVFGPEISWMANTFEQAGFDHASAEVGPTVSRFNVDAAADHIFTRGFEVLEAGKENDASASDHLPVWVRLDPVCEAESVSETS